jgi:hypothetical protein
MTSHAPDRLPFGAATSPADRPLPIPAGRRPAPPRRRPQRESVHDCRQQDLVFQKAMMRAVASGREHPPLIGIFKDARPLDAPRLFEPVPHSSGCTSPALACADLHAETDGSKAARDSTGPSI